MGVFWSSSLYFADGLNDVYKFPVYVIGTERLVLIIFLVNDPFVVKAWEKTYPENDSVKLLADGSARYTCALGLELDLSEKGLGLRSRRFALLVDNLVVKVAHIEQGGEFTVSSAEEMLKALDG